MEASKTLKNRGLTSILNREKDREENEENSQKYCVFLVLKEGFGKAGAGYESLPFEDRGGCPLTNFIHRHHRISLKRHYKIL